ncbi:MAG: hypothetical protein GY868_21945 [Deltaproteobacteria bacterium]|nr:hypothetical protein [Deltaproteobacteria bacterium]
MKKEGIAILIIVLATACVTMPGYSQAAYHLLDDKLRVKGSLYEFMMYRTDIPRQERDYRDTEWGLMRTKATLELLYKAVEQQDLYVNLFGFFHYWHEAVPDFDQEYHDSFTNRSRKQYQGPCFDQDDWINELYVDLYAGKWNLRLGKQIIIWSEVEMVRTIDRINSLDLRYTMPGIDPMDEMKLGLWMMRGFYNSDLPGQLVFEWIWIPGDFEQVRSPRESASMGGDPSPGGAADLRPRPRGQQELTDHLFYRARPAFALKNSSWAFRLRGNSEVTFFNDVFLLDWTVSWYHGMNQTPVARTKHLGAPRITNMDAGTLNGIMSRNAVSRVFGARDLPRIPGYSLYEYKFFDAIGASCQTYVPGIESVVRGEFSYEIGVPVNTTFPEHIDSSGSLITGNSERDQLNVGMTIDRPVRWPWLGQRWGNSAVLDCTFGWFSQWKLGNVARYRYTFGWNDRSQTNFTLMVKGRLHHTEFWPVIRFLYNVRNWGYGAFTLRYTPGKHMRYELGYLWFYAREPKDAKEAYAENKDLIYFKIGYEF